MPVTPIQTEQLIIIVMRNCCVSVTFLSLLRQCHKCVSLWVFYDWKPVGTEQEYSHSDLSIQQLFVSITQPAVVFVYFCPSSGVNKTPLSQRGAWVMRLVSLWALHPTGHGSASEMQVKWILEESIYIILYFCVCVFMLSPVTVTHSHRYHHQCTKHFRKQNNKSNTMKY